ncbi:hypothetical protein Nepgr_018913 [Nepenthes gracilis]|uniref:Uncharacterized protein n=1 Tax=Nepenthes gracilis TaxID=150966 RepID=A0AAD3SUX9_NEPGR|nr:hypothetical protein Nepgr_018913 [Nepenthes gracilis]
MKTIQASSYTLVLTNMEQVIYPMQFLSVSEIAITGNQDNGGKKQGCIGERQGKKTDVLPETLFPLTAISPLLSRSQTYSRFSLVVDIVNRLSVRLYRIRVRVKVRVIFVVQNDATKDKVSFHRRCRYVNGSRRQYPPAHRKDPTTTSNPWMMMLQPPRPQRPPTRRHRRGPLAKKNAASGGSPRPASAFNRRLSDLCTPPTSSNEIRSLWIGDLQYWVDEIF